MKLLARVTRFFEMGRGGSMSRRSRRIRNLLPDRSPHIIRHHIVNRCDGGVSEDYNLLHFWENREISFHRVFGNKTLVEAAMLLLRVARAKERQRCS